MNTIKNIITLPSLIFIFLPFAFPIIYKFVKEHGPDSEITFEYVVENTDRNKLWLMQIIRWMFDFTFYYYLIRNIFEAGGELISLDIRQIPKIILGLG